MATAKKCDRCNQLYEIYNEHHNSKKINGVLTVNTVEEANHYYSNKLLEFCPNCCNEFIQWFEKKGNLIDYFDCWEDLRHRLGKYLEEKKRRITN